ncbi:MAG: tetratricopeptide repeat protein [Methylococcales bacterium]
MLNSNSKKRMLVNNKMLLNGSLAVIAVSLFASGAPALAAKSDLIDAQQGGLGGLEQITSPADTSTRGAGSVLDSLRQTESDNKKNDYLDVLNLLKQNKLPEAKKKIAALLKQAPDADYYNLQALAETLEKNPVAAQQSYQKAISLNKNNILAHLGLAKLLLEQGELDKAKDYANQSLAINDKSLNAYLLLADVALKQKNIPEVEKTLLTAQDKIKGNIAAEVDVIRALGQFYAMQKQPEKILTISEDLAKRYPNHNTALAILAQAQILNNKNDLAEKTLLQLIEQDKKDIGARLLLVRLINNQEGKEKNVLKLLDDAVAIDANNPEPVLVKGAYLIKLKRTAEAMEIANKVDAQFPKLPIGKLLKGDVYLAEKNLDKALDIYQQAYKIKPNDKVLFTIVDLLGAQGKSADGIKLLNKELEHQNKNGAMHFKIATLYQAQKDYPQAEKHYKEILANQADNVLALNNLAWVYSQQNNPQALELAKQAYDKAAKVPAVADTYGAILVKQGQVKEGIAILEAAVALAPKANDIQYHLAEGYAAADDKKKALEILEVIVKSEQDFQEKSAAVSLLDKLKAK